MPFCAPQVVYSAVHNSQTSTYSDTFTAPSKGLYRLNFNVTGYATSLDSGVRYGGTVTVGDGQVLSLSVEGGGSSASGSSQSFTYSVPLNASDVVVLSASIEQGSPLFDTQFIVEQLA